MGGGKIFLKLLLSVEAHTRKCPSSGGKPAKFWNCTRDSWMSVSTEWKGLTLESGRRTLMTYECYTTIQTTLATPLPHIITMYVKDINWCWLNEMWTLWNLKLLLSVEAQMRKCPSSGGKPAKFWNWIRDPSMSVSTEWKGLTLESGRRTLMTYECYTTIQTK